MNEPAIDELSESLLSIHVDDFGDNEPEVTARDVPLLTTTQRGSKKLRYRGYIYTKIPPLFPPKIWNVFDYTLTVGDRTNNYCEDWNRHFESLVYLDNDQDITSRVTIKLLLHGAGRLEPKYQLLQPKTKKEQRAT